VTFLLTHLPDLSAASWTLVVVAALVVGFSKSALPGAGSVAAGMFALAMPAKESTAALLLLLILGDMTALWMYRREPDKRTLVRLIPSVIVGLVVGAVFLNFAGGDVVRRAIGVILIALVGVTVWRRRPRRKAGGAADGGDSGTGQDREPEAGHEATSDAPAEPAVGRIGRLGYGALGGFTTMVANAGGPVMSMYFLAMRMPVMTFLGTSAWFFAIVNILKLPFSASLGLFTVPHLLMDLVLAPLVIIGSVVGRKIAPHVPQQVFDKAVLALTVISSLALLV
jgi:uncharacterized membrane protein YfcA